MVECAVVPDHRRLVRMGFVDAARRAAIDHRLGYLLEMKGVAADRQQVARAAPRRVAVIIHHPQAVVAHDTGVGHEPRVVRPGRADLKDRIAGVAPPRLQIARGRDTDLLEPGGVVIRSEEHTSELQSLMRISYAVFCLNKKTK